MTLQYSKERELSRKLQEFPAPGSLDRSTKGDNRATASCVPNLSRLAGPEEGAEEVGGNSRSRERVGSPPVRWERGGSDLSLRTSMAGPRKEKRVEWNGNEAVEGKGGRGRGEKGKNEEGGTSSPPARQVLEPYQEEPWLHGEPIIPQIPPSKPIAEQQVAEQGRDKELTPFSSPTSTPTPHHPVLLSNGEKEGCR